MHLKLSRYLHSYGFVRRFPIGERQHFGPEHALRYAELLQESRDGPASVEQRVRLITERAHIEDLAGRSEVAQRSYTEAIALATEQAPTLVPELRYLQAKLRYRSSDWLGAQAELEPLGADPVASPLLRRRALLILGRVALEQGRFAAAIEALTEGLAGDNTPANLISGHLDLAYAYIHHSDRDRGLATLDKAEQILDPGQQIGRVAIAYYRGWIDLTRGQLAGARASLELARDQSNDLPTPDPRLCCELALSYLDLRSGRLHECLAGCERALALTGPQTRADLLLTGQLMRGLALMTNGRYAAAIDQFNRARDSAASKRLPILECRAYDGLAAVHGLVSEHTAAQGAIEESLRIRRRVGDPLGECIALVALAHVERQWGSLDRSQTALQEASVIAARIDNVVERAEVASAQAELYIANGNFGEAKKATDQAAGLLESITCPTRLAGVRALQAQIFSFQDRTEEALRAIDAAAQLVVDDPCRIYLAEVLITRAELLDDSGDRDGAARVLNQSSDLAAQCHAEALVNEIRRAIEELKEREFARRLLERYLDPRVVARLLARPERRVADSISQSAAILFSDIRGYTTVSEKLSPNEVVALLNEHFGAMSEEVHRFGGVIDKFMGDAIMVVFGDPGYPREDDPARAVQAAVAMVRRREAMNLERVAAGLPPIHIGVGIHVGPVVMGHIGSRHRVAYTVIGDAVNVSSRLETATKEHKRTILVSEEVALSPGQSLPVEPIGSLTLKGRSAPVRVYAIQHHAPQP